MLNASSAKDFALDVLNGTETWCFYRCFFSPPWAYQLAWDIFRIGDPCPEIKL